MLEKYLAEIDDVIKEAISTPEKTGVFWQGLIRKLNEIIVKIEIIFANSIGKDVERSYRKAISDTLNKLRSLKTLPKNIKNKIDYTAMLNADRTRNVINGIVNNAISDFNISLENNGRRITNYFNQLQRQNIIAYQGDVEPTQQNIKKKIINDLRAISSDKKYIKILDKNGVERNYNISKYSSMVTNYKIIEAKSQASINIAQSLGSDLVQVDFHNTLCEICGPAEGKIFSITGKDERFPKLDFDVPLHPNCYHILSPTFVEVLEIRGIDNYVKFSNGLLSEKDITKLFPSYIPFKERI